MIVNSKGFDPKNLKVFIGKPMLGNEIHMFRSRGFELTQNINESDIVVFTGGADISPSLYGEKPHQRTGPVFTRDQRELMMYRKSHGKFRFGICRGGQLLNVLSGGKLWQDVDHHNSGDHQILDVLTGRKLMATSVHHQAFRPGKGAIVIAVAKVSTRKESEHDTWFKGGVKNGAWETDYEVLFYPETRSLCIQSHPEFCEPNDHELVEYCFELLSRYYPVNSLKAA